MVTNIHQANAEWIAFIPEATTYKSTLEVHYDISPGWWSEGTEANLQGIKIAKNAGLKVMLKPHLVLGIDNSDWENGWRPTPEERDEWIKKRKEYIESKPDKTDSASWRGDLAPKNKEDWAFWEDQYTKYILAYAKMADSLDVDLFCIGTELKRSALERPEFWLQLIDKVREVYSGPLTYSANWDSYNQLTFWNKLDYIGVNAYFPLSSDSIPEVNTLIEKWEPYYNTIKSLSSKFQKPILFTEYGYRSLAFTTKEPWAANRHLTINQKAQSNALEALYHKFWNEPWCKGGFLWKWFEYPRSRDGNDRTFSPQNKEALQVVRKWYKIN